jgi:hypothetical protein
MSIAFDSFRWWRTEFDGRPNPCRSPVTNDGSTGPAAAMQTGNIGDELDPSMTLGGNVNIFFFIVRGPFKLVLASRSDFLSTVPLY